jgi:acetolactate synthase small subunit
VEASGAAEDEAYDVVEAFGASVVDVQADRGEQAVAELADGPGGLDEGG